MSKKSKKKLTVEDHGNGFMVIGTANVAKAARYLAKHYVDNGEDYRFATPNHYEGQSAVWLTTGPGEFWIGSTDLLGRPLPR
jgi:hypothetical protein